MDIYWHQLIWDGRWTALELLWNAVVVNVIIGGLAHCSPSS
jgi:hypothetical protein